MFISNVSQKWTMSIIACSVLLHSVCGIVTFEVQLTKFVSHGKDSDAHDCDLFGNNCDPKFTFCLDKVPGDGVMNHCQYGFHRTRHYQDQNTVYFGSDMKGVSNPIKATASSWPGSFKLKTEAIDDDLDSDDRIDKFFNTHTLTAASSISEASWTNVLLYGVRTRYIPELHYRIRAYCNADYFGSVCDVYCRASDDSTGHYTCDSDGNKVCRPGWETVSTSCTIKVDNCEDHKCKNGATCVDGYDGYTCDCPPGYKGNKCGVDINECSSGPCINGGNCTDEVNGYRCDCRPVYSGDRCQHHICDVSTYCQNGGTCYDDLDSVACMCPAQYTGIHCDVDTCDVLDCRNGGTCVRGSCECPPDYIGALCDVYLCEHITCQNGATCRAGVCVCPAGFTGLYCHLNIDDCEDNECEHDSTCLDETNGYTCSCLPGFSGTKCEVIECNCEHDGSCIDGVCHCPSNYTGDTCESHICDITYCDNGGKCEVIGGEAYCNCAQGFTGRYCDGDLCEEVLCHNGGSCVAGQCHCLEDFTGSHCDVDLCQLTSCENGGTCRAGTCLCVAGFTGQFCHVNIDECSSSPCQNDGECVDRVHKYHCSCQEGYNGTHCEETLYDPSISGSDALHTQDLKQSGGISNSVIGVIIAVVCVAFLIVLVIALYVRNSRNHKNAESSCVEGTEFDNPIYDDLTDGTGGSGAGASAFVVPVSLVKGKKDELEDDESEDSPPPYIPESQLQSGVNSLRVGPLSPPSYTESEAVYGGEDNGSVIVAMSQEPLGFVNGSFAVENEYASVRRNGENDYSTVGEVTGREPGCVGKETGNEYSSTGEDAEHGHSIVDNPAETEYDNAVGSTMQNGYSSCSNAPETVYDNASNSVGNGCDNMDKSTVHEATGSADHTESEQNEVSRPTEIEYDQVGKPRSIFENKRENEDPLSRLSMAKFNDSTV